MLITLFQVIGLDDSCYGSGLMIKLLQMIVPDTGFGDWCDGIGFGDWCADDELS